MPLKYKFDSVWTLLHIHFPAICNFSSFLLRLKHLQKYSTKILIRQSLLRNNFRNFLIDCLFISHCLHNSKVRTQNVGTIFRQYFRHLESKAHQIYTKRFWSFEMIDSLKFWNDWNDWLKMLSNNYVIIKLQFYFAWKFNQSSWK